MMNFRPGIDDEFLIFSGFSRDSLLRIHLFAQLLNHVLIEVRMLGVQVSKGLPQLLDDIGKAARRLQLLHVFGDVFNRSEPSISHNHVAAPATQQLYAEHVDIKLRKHHRAHNSPHVAPSAILAHFIRYGRPNARSEMVNRLLHGMLAYWWAFSIGKEWQGL